MSFTGTPDTMLKRNRTDARAVCQVGRSNGFSPGPDCPLAKPRFPPTGVSAVSGVFGGLDQICIPSVPPRALTHVREVPLFNVPLIPARNLRPADPRSTRFLFQEI